MKIITSFISEFLVQTKNEHLISQFNIHSFSLNVLDKRRTMIEKLVSLIRFSFSDNPTLAIASKIRHFYDLYFLANDGQCAEYIQCADFKLDFKELYVHDQQIFDMPINCQNKTLDQSPLINDFSKLWKRLKETYRNELSQLAFTQIPDEELVANTFIKIMQYLTEENNTK